MKNIFAWVILSLSVGQFSWAAGGGEMQALAERCSKGDKAACTRLEMFGKGFSNVAKEAEAAKEHDKVTFTELCKKGSKDACQALELMKKEKKQ